MWPPFIIIAWLFLKFRFCTQFKSFSTYMWSRLFNPFFHKEKGFYLKAFFSAKPHTSNQKASIPVTLPDTLLGHPPSQSNAADLFYPNILADQYPNVTECPLADPLDIQAFHISSTKHSSGVLFCSVPYLWLVRKINEEWFHGRQGYPTRLLQISFWRALWKLCPFCLDAISISYGGKDSTSDCSCKYWNLRESVETWRSQN